MSVVRKGTEMDRRRRGPQATRFGLSLGVFYFVFFVIIYFGYSFEWMGLSGQTTIKEIRHYDDNGKLTETVQEEQRTPPKTLWDYFVIVAAPAAATVVAHLTSRFQRRRSEDDAFQAYTSQIGDLISEGKLRKPQDGDNDANVVRTTLTFARARTLTVLEESSSALK